LLVGWGGRPQAPARFGGAANPPGPILWSGPILGADGCPCLLPAPARRPVRVTCARISSYRAAVCACIRRFKGVAPRGARSSSCPGYLWLNALSYSTPPHLAKTRSARARELLASNSLRPPAHPRRLWNTGGNADKNLRCTEVLTHKFRKF